MTVTINGTTGVTTPEVTLDNSSADGGQVVLKSSGYSNWNWDNYSGNLRAYYGSTEAMRIDSSGNLLVGRTSTLYTAKVTIDGGSQRSIATYINTTANAIQVSFDNPNGNVGGIYTNGTATAYGTSSDYRLKENIQPMQNALGVVAQLNPVTYTWKADGSDGQGFIAHELQAVVPDCVTGEKDAVDAEGKPVYQGIDTSFLVATLTKAIQELKAEVDDLKAQLEAK